jgi:hypothetical protein
MVRHGTGMQLPRLFLVERYLSVAAGGMMLSIPVMSGRLRVRVNGRQTKTTS